jgi:hypothetical protein
MHDDKFQAAIEQIDAANAEDPNREQWQGESRPKELLYGERMSAWLDRLQPNASDVLQLAVRAQHIRRWALARSEYPEGRSGYKKWRIDCAQMHAREAAAILADCGYDPADVEHAQRILRKDGIKRDADVQALEDCACLVFLEFHFAAFTREHNEEKLLDILRKTWKKMSDGGHELALTIDLDADCAALVAKALAP